MEKKSLYRLGREYGTDQSGQHKYTTVFPNYMGYYEKLPVRFLEIGIKKGASLRMWNDYFEHEDAHLVAVDNDLTTFEHVPMTPRWHMALGSQYDKEFLATVGEEHGPFDIIVDDGCHHPEAQITAFKGLWPFISRGGIYVIEDLYESFTKGNQSLVTYLDNMTKSLVVSGKRHGKTSYDFIHYYKNMVVIGKKTRA